ncbi:MAG: hypothetical protein RRC07_00935 [Anaerolineae bacterium]|nr:hypothetical protein [Anaerolineae bacterium]
MAVLTRVNPHTRILRERLLPHAGEVAVSKGQKVSPVQVVARASEPQGFAVVPAAEILGVAASELSRYLLVEEGAAVQRKKPLLRQRKMLGSTEYVSPINGVLYQVSSGRLILQHTPRLLELRAMVEGTVHSIRPGRGVVIATSGAVIQAAWATQQEGYGRLRIAAAGDSPLRERHIDADVRGTVLVAGCLTDVQALKAAEDNSARGVIVGSAPASLLPALHTFRFPIMITEGFMGQPMAEPLFQLLQEAEGRDASLFGQSNTSGGSRPEIIIPMPATQPLQTGAPEAADVKVGDRVRILRAPYASQVGKVVAVFTQPRRTSIGIQTPGADVELPDGEVVFIPDANLDLLR